MKLNSIQFLRAIAVILVAYNHSIDIQMQFGFSWQQDTHLQKFGAIGVDIFFVISGFIISFVADRYIGVAQGFHFLKKRFIRINPIYYIASLLFLLTTIIRSQIIHSQYINLKESFSSIIDTLLVVPVTETTASYLPLLRIGWTLSFEWFFYFLFLMLIISGIKQKILLLGVTIAFLITLGYIYPVHDLRYAFITNPIMLEFLTGTIIYFVYAHTKPIPVKISILLLAVGLTSYTILIIYGYGNVWNSSYVRDESMKRFALWGVPSSFIVASSIFLEGNQMFKFLWNNKLMQLIGNASYSIYLVHITVYVWFTALYRRAGFFLPADASIFLQLIIAVLAGIGFYKIVEKPLLQVLNQWKHEIIPKNNSIFLEVNK